jgi:hypothetical protein
LFYVSFYFQLDEVLVEAENTRLLMIDLRKKMLTRIKALENLNKDMESLVRDLFDEIDEKGNGWIDKFHFRLLLRSLKLTYADDRFNRLYRALDSSGDGKLEWEELHELLFGHLDDNTSSHHNNHGSGHMDNSEGPGGGGGEGGNDVQPFHPHPFLKSSSLMPALEEDHHDDARSVHTSSNEGSDSDGNSSRGPSSRRNSRFSNASSSKNQNASSVKSSTSPRASFVKSHPRAASPSPSSPSSSFAAPVQEIPSLENLNQSQTRTSFHEKRLSSADKRKVTIISEPTIRERKKRVVSDISKESEEDFSNISEEEIE